VTLETSGFVAARMRPQSVLNRRLPRNDPERCRSIGYTRIDDHLRKEAPLRNITLGNSREPPVKELFWR
jgi:hypothetical protein